MPCCVFAHIDERRGRETSLSLGGKALHCLSGVICCYLVCFQMFGSLWHRDQFCRGLRLQVADPRICCCLSQLLLIGHWATPLLSLVWPLPSPPVAPLVERSFEHRSFVGLFLCELVVVPWCRSVVCCSLVLVVGSNLGSGLCHQLVSIYTRYWLFSAVHSLYNRY